MPALVKILVVLFFLTGTGSAQSIIVNENFIDTELEDALKSIRKNYGVKIAYDNQLVESIRVTETIVNAPLNEALKQLLDGTGLGHRTLNEKIIIIPQPTPPSNVVPVRTDIGVSGVIKDEETGETLPNATVYITGTMAGTTTNTDGYFSLVKIPSDTCSISINYLGYVAQKIYLKDIKNLNKMFVSLRTDSKVLKEVVVTDSYESPLEVTDDASKSAFDPKALTSLPSMGEHDIFRTLQLLPGVGGTNESSAGLVIRGSVPSQNLILLDGFTIYHLDHFFGVFSAINADFIKDVQIFKGGFDAKYGGRASGVVDITGKSGNTNYVKGTFGINLISTNATIEIPVGKKVSMIFSTRRAYSDIIQSSLYKNLFDIARNNDDQIRRPFENAKLDEIDPKFYFYDFNSKVTYRPSRKDNISLSIYGGKDNLSGNRADSLSDISRNFSFKETLDEGTVWGNNGLSLRWGRQWTGRFYTNVKISGSNFFRDYNFKYTYLLDSTNFNQQGNFEFVQENRVDDSNLSIDHEWLVGKRVTLEFGISAMEYKIHYKTAANGTVGDGRDDKGNIGSLYTTAKVRLSEKLQASVGIRSNHHQINEEWYSEPRLALNYKFNNQFSLKGAVGRYYQFVNLIQYDDPYVGIQNFWAFSNKNGVPIVESNHYIAGATLRLKGFLFDVEGYYKDVEGVVEFNPVPYFVKDGVLDQGLLMNGSGRMSGIDFLVQKQLGKYKGWISYSWSKSLHSFPSIEDGTFYPSLQDQPHEFKLVNMLRLGRWDLSCTWLYGSGRPFPEYNITYFTDSNGNVEDFVVSKDLKNYSRLPAYHRLDVSASYNFFIGKTFGEIGLSIFNLYDHQNVKTRKLSIPFLERTLQTPDQPLPEYRDLQLIGFTPTFFLIVGF
ncbi:MAG TPA: TonB-dependent receptor [Chryseolinea sp.]|nr:TonB-dependent receptor [Chryseolinea sp.]